MSNTSTQRTTGRSERQIRRELNARLRKLEYGSSTADPLTNPSDATFAQRTHRALILILLTALVPGGAQSVTGNHRLGRIGLSVTLINWALIVLAVLGYLVARD